MAISSYAELKTAISTWTDRNDLTDSQLAEIVALAEAVLNRELQMVESDATLTGTIGSRAISISSYDILEPVAVFLVDTDMNREVELIQKADGQFPYYTDNGEPSVWSIDGDNINFDCPLDQAYTFRFRYKGKFALSDSVTTNQLLQDAPDVYLAACIVWSGFFVEDTTRIQMWAQVFESGLRSIKNQMGKLRRGTLTVDPMLVTNAPAGSYRW